MPTKDLTCFTTKDKVVVCKAADSKEGKLIAAKKKKKKVIKIITVEPKPKPKPKPKVTDKVKKFIEGGQQKGNRLDNLPSELKDKIIEKKKEVEEKEKRAKEIDDETFKVGEWKFVSYSDDRSDVYDKIKIIAVRPNSLTLQLWEKRSWRESSTGGNWLKAQVKKFKFINGTPYINMGSSGTYKYVKAESLSENDDYLLMGR